MHETIKDKALFNDNNDILLNKISKHTELVQRVNYESYAQNYTVCMTFIHETACVDNYISKRKILPFQSDQLKAEISPSASYIVQMSSQM